MTNVVDFKPKDTCLYCGGDAHPDFTCPRIQQVIVYPSGTWSVVMHPEFYLEVDVEFDTDEDDPA